MSRTKLLERTEMVIRYDVTNLSKDEIDALEDEARAVAENKDRHASVDVIDVDVKFTRTLIRTAKRKRRP